MPDWLLLGAAALSGLLGGPHCALMCGGIAVALPQASGADSPLRSALLTNLGRVGGYALSGALAGGLGSGLLALARIPQLPVLLRSLAGLVLLALALRVIWPGFGRRGIPLGSQLWRGLAPLRQRASALPPSLRALAMGALWGWLPCGLSLGLLTAAWFSASTLQGALTMAAFGLGTLPLMTTLGFSGARLDSLLRRNMLRWPLAMLIGLAGLLTLLAPWLGQHPWLHPLLRALGCASLPAG
jgi:hypothetical protein